MVVDQGCDSQESTTLTLEQTLDVSFEDISYTVRSGPLLRNRKTILSCTSGSFQSGELSVLVGQSGAGKSTLMDILAGFTKATTGRLYVNGQIRDDIWFRRRSCYIMQDDQIQDLLTVKESLIVASNLKLGRHISTIQHNKRVNEMIDALGLSSSRHTRTGSLSGGQKKRLAIALELITHPPVLFLDEPTSGLDSYTSKQLVFLLHQLARQGHTVIVTMHQPSMTLLGMVDRLHAVVNGRCAYTGSVGHLLPYLSSQDLHCPPYHNPVDFLLEICSGVFGSYASEKLIETCMNGKSTSWISNKGEISDSSIEKSLACIEVPFTPLPLQKDIDANNIFNIKSTYATSFWNQFCILTCRSLKCIVRSSFLTFLVAGIYCCIALAMSCLYYDIGADAKYVRDNYNFLNFSLMFLMFTAFSLVSVNFPLQLPVVRREHFNRWYGTGAYFCSTLVAALPVQTLCVLGYALITYYLTGQPAEWPRFFGFSWMLLHVSFVALCIGLLNGALFTIKNGVVFGSFFIMPFTIFSGFFLRYSDAPFFFKWLFHVSFLKHGLIGLIISIFGMDREKLPCSDIYCHYSQPKIFLKDHDASTELYSMVVLSLFAIIIVVLLSAYLMLRLRLTLKW